MITRTLTLALASTAALALAACGEAPEETTTDTDVVAMDTETTSAFDPMSRDYELSAEQQARRDAFDSDAFSSEYEGYRTAMAEDTSMANMTRDSYDYGTLDRNADGRLSAAEYSFYANPDYSAALSDEQIGRIANSYYYYDTDGDGYISSAEFDSLRSGGTSASSMSGSTGADMDAEPMMADEAADNPATSNTAQDKRAGQ